MTTTSTAVKISISRGCLLKLKNLEFSGTKMSESTYCTQYMKVGEKVGGGRRWVGGEGGWGEKVGGGRRWVGGEGGWGEKVGVGEGGGERNRNGVIDRGV